MRNKSPDSKQSSRNHGDQEAARRRAMGERYFDRRPSSKDNTTTSPRSRGNNQKNN